MKDKKINYDEETGLPILNDDSLFWKISSTQDFYDVHAKRAFVTLFHVRPRVSSEMTVWESLGAALFGRTYLVDEAIESNSAPLKESMLAYWSPDDHEEAVANGWIPVSVYSGGTIDYYVRPAKEAVKEAATEIYQKYLASQAVSDLDELKGTYILEHDRYVRKETGAASV